MDNKIALIIILFGVTMLMIGFCVGVQYQKDRVDRLPACNYSMIGSMEGNHLGYWVGETDQRVPECIVRFDNTTVGVNAGKL